MKRIVSFACSAIIALLLLSCSKAEEKSCEGPVLCTFEFRSIPVKVLDKQGKPVALSRIKITNLSNGQDLTRQYHSEQWSMMQAAGSYPIASDSDSKYLPKHKNTSLRFQGYVGSKEVVNAVYVVTFDCCHISLVSGDREVTIN